MTVDGLNDLLLGVAVQFPLLVLFVLYNHYKDKQFQAFLDNQRKEFLEGLDRITVRMTEHEIESHDHQENCMRHIAVMETVAGIFKEPKTTPRTPRR